MSGGGHEGRQRRTRRTKMETPYSRITEIKEASTEKEANRLLEQGFFLVKVSQRVFGKLG